MMQPEEAAKCRHYSDQDYIQPVYELDIEPIWDMLYFYLVILVAYVGSILTIILMSGVLYNQRTIPDVLVGILAINNFAIVMICFTPTVIAQLVDHWFGKGVCFMHILLNKFFVSNTLIVIILLSIEGFWAISKPFHYQRHSTHKLVVGVLAISTFFSFLLSLLPPVLMPYSLLPGWYCDVVFYRDISGDNCTLFYGNYDYLLKTYVGLEVSIVCIGLGVASTCNMGVVNTLKKKMVENKHHQDMKLEKRMIYAITLMDCAFGSTWLPILISILLCLFGDDETMCAKSEYTASRMVNINVAINPFLYALMKPSYRRGYAELLKKLIQCFTFGQLNSSFTVNSGADAMLTFQTPIWSQVNKIAGRKDVMRKTANRKPSRIELIENNSGHDAPNLDQNEPSTFQMSVSSTVIHRETIGNEIDMETICHEIEADKYGLEKGLVDSSTSTTKQSGINIAKLNLDRIEDKSDAKDTLKLEADTVTDALSVKDTPSHSDDLNDTSMDVNTQTEGNAHTNDALSIEDECSVKNNHTSHLRRGLTNQHDDECDTSVEETPDESRQSVFKFLRKISSGKVSPIPS